MIYQQNGQYTIFTVINFIIVFTARSLAIERVEKRSRKGFHLNLSLFAVHVMNNWRPEIRRRVTGEDGMGC